MSNSLNIRDVNTLDEEVSVSVLEFLTETITVKELIRSRVYQEVKDYNTRPSTYFSGLVQPTETEQTLNGYELKVARKISWEAQFERAIAAFKSNGFIILVNDEQAIALDEKIIIAPETTVAFLKLVPLVGG